MAARDGVLSVGSWLRGLRLGAGGSLDELARATRISEGQLKALEADDFSELPAPVFVKGFIRAYCGFFGAPPDQALALYRSGLESQPPLPPRALSARPRASWISHPIVVSGVLLVVFGGGLLALNVAGRGGIRRTPETGPAARESGPSASALPTPATVITADGQESPQAQRLVAKAVEATWIRVETDDGRVVTELLPPGATREWTSGKGFVLTVGNAGGVRLELNGRPLPALGARGAVIRQLALPESPAGS